MARCIALSKNRPISCMSGLIGGIKNIYFAEWEENAITATEGEVSTIGAAITEVFKYRVKNDGNTWTEEIVTDPQNFTRSFDSTVSVVLQGLDIETRNEINEMTKGQLLVFIELNDGSVLVQGAVNGAMITGGNANVDGANNGFVGYNLTITASEPNNFYKLSSAGKTALAALVHEDEAEG